MSYIQKKIETSIWFTTNKILIYIIIILCSTHPFDLIPSINFHSDFYTTIILAAFSFFLIERGKGILKAYNLLYCFDHDIFQTVNANNIREEISPYKQNKKREAKILTYDTALKREFPNREIHKYLEKAWAFNTIENQESYSAWANKYICDRCSGLFVAAKLRFILRYF